MSPDRVKFARRALAVVALVLLVCGLALPREASARDPCADPNLQQRIEQFIWKPAPENLILKPQQDAGDKPPAKKPKHGKN
jgi:hypothetical protein